MIMLAPRPTTGCLLVILLLVALPGETRDPDQLPTPFGVRFHAADVPLPEPLPPRRSVPEAEAWEQRVRDTEYSDGPYGDGMAEVLMDAANYFSSRGDFNTALGLWRRSVHLVRVNEGLYSPLQLPALERQLDTYLRLGDFEAADEVKSYLYFLARRRYEPADPALVAATVDWIDWRRRQWLREPNPQQPKPLLSLWRELARRTKEDDAGMLGLEELAPLTYAQIDLLYVVGTTDFGIDRETEMLLSSGAARADAALDIDRAQAQALQGSAYARGRARLELLLERAAQAGDTLEQARANRALGDWFLWNGSSKRAAPHYRDSWRQLAELGELALQQAWYGTPVELPADNIMWVPASPLESDNSVAVRARFNVDARGRPREVEAQLLDSDSEARRIRLVRLLRDTRFRPRLDNGEMVETTGLERQYQVP